MINDKYMTKKKKEIKRKIKFNMTWATERGRSREIPSHNKNDTEH